MRLAFARAGLIVEASQAHQLLAEDGLAAYHVSFHKWSNHLTDRMKRPKKPASSKRQPSGMKRIDKVIISCAITGSIHTPTMSEALPVSAAQIAEQAIDAARAGAAILHLHARKEEDGSPTQDPSAFRRFLPSVKQSCDAVVNIKGKMARSNAEQVMKIRHIMEDLSLEIATPDEARRMLNLKGAGSVGF
jgi:beta-keto acid cleavage enzyme